MLKKIAKSLNSKKTLIVFLSCVGVVYILPTVIAPLSAMVFNGAQKYSGVEWEFAQRAVVAMRYYYSDEPVPLVLTQAYVSGVNFTPCDRDNVKQDDKNDLHNYSAKVVVVHLLEYKREVVTARGCGPAMAS